MKKLLPFLLFLSLVFLFSACSEESDTKPLENNTSPPNNSEIIAEEESGNTTVEENESTEEDETTESEEELPTEDTSSEENELTEEDSMIPSEETPKEFPGNVEVIEESSLKTIYKYDDTLQVVKEIENNTLQLSLRKDMKTIPLYRENISKNIEIAKGYGDFYENFSAEDYFDTVDTRVLSLSDNGRYLEYYIEVFCIECSPSGSYYIYDIENEKVLFEENSQGFHSLIFIDNDTKVIVADNNEMGGYFYLKIYSLPDFSLLADLSQREVHSSCDYNDKYGSPMIASPLREYNPEKNSILYSIYQPYSYNSFQGDREYFLDTDTVVKTDREEIEEKDENLATLKKYYELIEDNNFEEAYEMQSVKDVGIGTFTSWYKCVLDVELSDIQRTADNRYEFVSTLTEVFETGVYNVVMEVQDGKVKKISSTRVNE